LAFPARVCRVILLHVAVSIPDPLFRDARLSRRLRVPRSQFYSRALEAFVRQHSGEEVTARLDAVLARLPAEDREPWEGPALEVLRREKW
jgi:hypothetical protein